MRKQNRADILFFPTSKHKKPFLYNPVFDIIQTKKKNKIEKPCKIKCPIINIR
jgi:hypothetical protein